MVGVDGFNGVGMVGGYVGWVGTGGGVGFTDISVQMLSELT